MTLIRRNLWRGAAAAALASGATLAHAHTGHETGSLLQGLGHPFGLDHLLAAVAVGLWSARALPRARAWQGPAVFLLALAAAALAGHGGMGPAWTEQGIALSVVLFGAMLMLARGGVAAHPARGLALVAAAASLHGLAHGGEAAGSAFAPYAVGFLASTALLHTAGLGAGATLERLRASAARRAALGLGAGLGAAGLYLLGA